MASVATTGIALDTEQQRVVEHDGGPLLVLGGPGAGKTTVLIERWVRLATEITRPHRVLLLLPTRDRTLQLRDELPWRLPQRAIVEAPVHTWHAFAYHLVTRYYRSLGYTEPPVLLTAAEQWSVVRDLLSSEDPHAWGVYGEQLIQPAFIHEVTDFCVRVGQRATQEAHLTELAQRRPGHEAVVTFARRYREHLRSTARLDYAGLVAAAARLLEEDPQVGEAVRERFPHVLVDDAQELAPAQLELLRHLSLEHLVCAGDPDSAIEAFRGSDPTWLDRFDELAPECERVTLTTSHRHGSQIGTVAARLIAHAPHPGPHRPTDFAGPPEGEAHLRCHATMAGEIDAAVREVRYAHLAEGVPYERMAILVAQPSTYLHPLRRTLERLEVPYRVTAGDQPLTAEPAVRAVLDLFRLTLDEAPDDLVASVLASPLVGLHLHRIREIRRVAYTRNLSLAETVDDPELTDCGELRRLRDLARAAAEEPADAAFASVFDASSWCRTLVEHRHTDREAARHLDALVALSRSLGHFVERRHGGTMLTYLSTTAEAGFGEDTWVPASHREAGVAVMSFHAAKGLEWELVCVVGVAEGQIPKAHRAQGLFDPWALDLGSPMDQHLAQLAEERRTLYVAISRARGRLVVSCSPGFRRATPSRFLEEAFGEVPEPEVADTDERPLTLPEAEGTLRRTIASALSTDAEKAAAAAALSRIPGIDPTRWWWRRDFTDAAPLAEERLLTTSYSRIGRYDNCPLQYVLESVLGLDPASTYQMRFGSLVHQIFERSDPLLGDISTLDEALEIYKQAWLEGHKDDYPNLMFARTYYRAGVRMISLWWNTERRTGETLSVEYSFDDLPVDGHILRGRIDRVAKTRDGLVLTDYKTSSRMPRVEEAKESLQLAIYYLAAKHYDDLRRHGEPARMQLVFPGVEQVDRETGAKRIGRRFQTAEDAEAALGRLQDILAAASEERFDPSPTADCQWCRMKPLCPRWPEGREVGP